MEKQRDKAAQRMQRKLARQTATPTDSLSETVESTEPTEPTQPRTKQLV